MNTPVIRFENISKKYRLGSIGTRTLRGDLQRWWSRVVGNNDPNLKVGHINRLNYSPRGNASDYVWALKDINLDVNKGDILGIIGKNGAGKSTLLKLLSRITAPTTGVIKIKGRIASLLEVGTGFHPELTGKENVYLNGAILGMTKSEITDKFDEIVEFAGVSKYIGTPVKRYSSGMYVRLAFAVAAHLEPDILVVDEVLAVGDAEFQRKAIGKMQDVSRGEGRTVLFVSHNMGAVRDLCTKALILKEGGLDFIGSTEDAITNYLKSVDNKLSSVYVNSNPNSESDILEVSLHDSNMQNCSIFSTNEEITVIMKLKISDKHLLSTISVRVRDNLGRNVCTNERHISEFVNKAGIYTIKTNIPKKFLLPNTYSLIFALHIVNQEMISFLDSPVSFEVQQDDSSLYQYGNNDLGCVFVDSSWSLV